MSDTGFTVEAYSGYRYGERPRAFTWRGRRYEVLTVERRWRTPRGSWFVVTAALRTRVGSALEEGAGLAVGGAHRPCERWELRYDEAQDTWHVRRADIKGDTSGEKETSP